MVKIMADGWMGGWIEMNSKGSLGDSVDLGNYLVMGV